MFRVPGSKHFTTRRCYGTKMGFIHCVVIPSIEKRSTLCLNRHGALRGERNQRSCHSRLLPGLPPGFDLSQNHMTDPDSQKMSYPHPSSLFSSHSTSAMKAKRAIRIGGASGSAMDRRIGFAQLASGHPGDPVDVIIGDFMSEGNMTGLAARKVSSARPAYDATFLEALGMALDDIARNGIKVVVNAGGTDTERLHQAVLALLKKRNVSLSVAWISGDEVLPVLLQRAEENPDAFTNSHTGEQLSSWPHKPIYAQCYLGGMGIAAALKHGADIVVCGRVSDASPIIGAAAWWHDWGRSQLPQLANALVAGHLIECSTYVTGGNFTGFKKLEKGQRWLDLGYPIAEISAEGAVVITKRQGTGGVVSVATCTSQLLYEIQGPWYFNSDVTAILNTIAFTQIGKNRVALSGVQSAPPPPTTKVGVTAIGGFHAECHYYLVGLDVAAKARMFEQQNAATATLRIVAQAKREADLAPHRFLRPLRDLIMAAYPGGTVNMDARMSTRHSCRIVGWQKHHDLRRIPK
ncbi:hypothetical protein MKEN_00388400 [Mycena kentingensis (nom. inval.)]|nr:hypothetical protein MKEN_00388400 [Mycena kentingensis (nom. inval.)]